METWGPIKALCAHPWHDGDTGFFDLDLGFDHLIVSKDWDDHPRLKLRVKGLQAPELHRAGGSAALAYAMQLCPVGTRVTVLSYGWDNYGGRFDGEITLPDGTDFTAAMLAAGHGVPYAGLHIERKERQGD